LATEQAYKSQGKAVAKQAVEQAAHRKVDYKGHKIEAWRLSDDPKVNKASGATLPHGLEKGAFEDFPKDVQENAVGTPTSLAHIAVREGGAAVKSAKTGSIKPLVKAQAQTAKEFAQPYKQLYDNPGKFISEHPATFALMVAPTGKIAGLGVGRVA